MLRFHFSSKNIMRNKQKENAQSSGRHLFYGGRFSMNIIESILKKIFSIVYIAYAAFQSKCTVASFSKAQNVGTFCFRAVYLPLETLLLANCAMRGINRTCAILAWINFYGSIRYDYNY